MNLWLPKFLLLYRPCNAVLYALLILLYFLVPKKRKAMSWSFSHQVLPTFYLVEPRHFLSFYKRDGNLKKTAHSIITKYILWKRPSTRFLSQCGTSHIRNPSFSLSILRKKLKGENIISDEKLVKSIKKWYARLSLHGDI